MCLDSNKYLFIIKERIKFNETTQDNAEKLFNNFYAKETISKFYYFR